MHAGEDRIVGQAEAARDVEPLAAYGVEVGRIVDEREQLVAGGLEALDGDAGSVEHAQLAREPHGQIDANRVERVFGPEVVGGEPVVPENAEGSCPVVLGDMPDPLIHGRHATG